jgi:hypothetical protein
MFNPKCHDLLFKHMKSDPSFEFVTLDFEATLRLIDECQDREDAVIIFYQQNPVRYYEQIVALSDILEYVDSRKHMKAKIVFVTFDFWIGRINATFTKRVFLTKNHCVITFARSVEQLEHFNRMRYSPQKIGFLNLWCVYDLAIVPFNPNPIRGVLLPGSANTCYPERVLAKRCEQLKMAEYNLEDNFNLDNRFNRMLNEHLACFTSSIYVRPVGSERMENTHIVLLKVFEILGSGSLLIVPDSEQEYLAELGLKSGEHYLACSMPEFEQTVKFVEDDANRQRIDQIRRAGQEFAIANLNSSKKYQEFKQVLLSL